MTDELQTIIDLIRYGASRFNAAGLTFGHSYDNALDEATQLVLHALHLPHDLPPVYGQSRVTLAEKEDVLKLFLRRIEERIPAAYLTGEASLKLLGVYGGMPAREGDRDAFFAGLDETYPQGVNWDVARTSLNYPDIPSHEAWYPNFNKGQTRFSDFQSLLKSSPDIDVAAELDKLQSDLQAIVDEVE